MTARFESGMGTLLVKLDEGNGPRWHHLSRGEKSWVLRTYSADGVTSTSYAPGLPELDLQDGAIVDQVKASDLERLLGRKPEKWGDVAFWSDVFGRLDDALKGKAGAVEPGERQVTVPTIPLRSLYDIFVALSPRDAQEHLAQALAPYPRKLAQLFDESVRMFDAFHNPDEGFTGDTDGRRQDRAPEDPREATSDVEVSVLLKERHENRGVVEGARNLDFIVVEREVVPERATGTAMRGRRIDWLAMNAHDRTPILAEIKVRNDNNPFYALIQLLLYAATLSTGSQQTRLRRHFPALKELPEPPSDDSRTAPARFDLYIVLVDLPAQLQPFLELARTTAQALVREPLIASKIRRVACLRADLAPFGLRFTSEFVFEGF